MWDAYSVSILKGKYAIKYHEVPDQILPVTEVKIDDIY